jgi:formylglycine-generating enzyme required for sulfatase activity
MVKLFISYRSLDSEKVDMLVARLKSLKKADNTPLYDIWQDKTSIPDGHDWWGAIVDAIIDCDIFIFMLSRESANNINCRAELSYARRRNRPILPLVIEGEFTFNAVSGKNDISYWNDIPQELNDIRAQFLFYEGTSFVKRVEDGISLFQRERKRWRDIPADRPPDPRDASEATNNTTVLYDQAVDYAWRLELNTAERLFQRLVNLNDPNFGEDAHEWILILREYQKLLDFDARDSTRHKVQPNWLTYRQKFPKPFVELFDPKGFKDRYENTRSVATAMLKPDMKTILPPPCDWIDITQGDVTLISYEITGKKNYLNQNTTVFVPAFAIAKYPVTNAQFKRFINARGYERQEWWTGVGWQEKEREGWKEPRYWNDSEFNSDLQPVVGVSWYEAVAFCLWLRDVTGYEIMLPSEQQWQRAAQGDDGRSYPWDNTWDGGRCNNDVSREGYGKTTSVTYYEGRDKGDSYFGVVDMAGNVWEWCRSAFNYDADSIYDTNFRTLRGGSWGGFITREFRADYSVGGEPNRRGPDWGFRFALSYK